MDRFDLRVEVPPVAFSDLSAELPTGERSESVALRVREARAVQAERYSLQDGVDLNADLTGDLLQSVAKPDASGQEFLNQAAEKMGLSGRGYHRILRVARTIADLAGQDAVGRAHVAEAVAFRIVGQAL